jgi:hypothetical protein
MGNVMGNGMKIAFVIYHLNRIKVNATLKNIVNHPLLKNLSSKDFNKALKIIWDFGIIIPSTEMINNNPVRTFSVFSPDIIKDYGILKKWLTVEETFLLPKYEGVK